MSVRRSRRTGYSSVGNCERIAQRHGTWRDTAAWLEGNAPPILGEYGGLEGPRSDASAAVTWRRMRALEISLLR